VVVLLVVIWNWTDWGWDGIDGGLSGEVKFGLEK